MTKNKQAIPCPSWSILGSMCECWLRVINALKIFWFLRDMLDNSAIIFWCAVSWLLSWQVFLGGKCVSEGWRPIRVVDGRRKRKYRRMFTDEELEYAARILNFFAPRPRCVCGSRSFKYRIGKNGMLEAFCLECNMRYVFEPKKRMWLHTAVSPLLAVQDEIIIQNDEVWELMLWCRLN